MSFHPCGRHRAGALAIHKPARAGGRARQRARRLVAVGTVVAALASIGVVEAAGTAYADPSITYLAVGSDTTQDVLNAFANDLGGNLLGSFDAVNPVTGASHDNITAAKTGTGIGTNTSGPQKCGLTRPNGSNDGLTALRESLSSTSTATPLSGQAVTVTGTNSSNTIDTVTGALPGLKPELGCVDIARSANPPTNTVVSASAGEFIYIPFALDAIAGGIGPATAGTIGGVPAAATKLAGASQFTDAQLQTLYGSCQPVTVTVNGTSVTYDPTGKIAGDTPIDLYVPQAGSGLRTLWGTALNFSTSTLPSCVFDRIQSDGGLVPASYLGQSVQQNDGTAVAVDPNGYEPYSVAQYISQTKNLDTRLHGIQIQPLGGVSPVTTSGTLNINFPIRHEVYNVVQYDRVVNTGDGTYDPNLAGLFVGTNSQLCQDAAEIVNYGFATLSAAPLGHTCGAVAATNLRAYTAAQI